MIILGIDPGSRKTGYAYLDTEISRQEKVIEAGVLIFAQYANFFERIKYIHQTVKELIKRRSPDEVAIESLIFKKGPTSLIKLAQARGAIISGLESIPFENIYEYSPNLVKSMAVGHGHASKDYIMKGLQGFLQEGVSFQTHDVSDALAVALCHIQFSKQKLLLRNGKAKVVAPPKGKVKRKSSSSSLQASLAHRIHQLRSDL